MKTVRSLIRETTWSNRLLFASLAISVTAAVAFASDTRFKETTRLAETPPAQRIPIGPEPSSKPVEVALNAVVQKAEVLSLRELTAMTQPSARAKPSPATEGSVGKAANIEQLVRTADMTAAQRRTARDTRREPKDGYVFGPGDRLNILFYGRTDLSGLKTIDDQGYIDMPVVGLVEAKGKTAYAVRKEIVERFEAISGAEAYVTVDVAERRPFYVLGLVNKPGAYAYVPGISLVQALALSGGLSGRTENEYLLMRSHDARAQFKQLLNKVERELAKQARLRAELADGEQVDVPRKLLQFTSQAEAAQLCQDETEVLKLNLLSYETQRDALAAAIKYYKEEQTNEKARLAKAEKWRSTQESRLRGVASLVKAKTLSQNTYEDIHRGIQNTESEIHDIAMNLSKIERELVDRQQELAMLKTKRVLDTKKELIASETAASELEQQLESTQELIRSLGVNATIDFNGAENKLVLYELIRGDNTFVASDDTKLLPGDVVRVKLSIGKPQDKSSGPSAIN